MNDLSFQVVKGRFPFSLPASLRPSLPGAPPSEQGPLGPAHLSLPGPEVLAGVGPAPEEGLCGSRGEAAWRGSSWALLQGHSDPPVLALGPWQVTLRVSGMSSVHGDKDRSPRRQL